MLTKSGYRKSYVFAIARNIRMLKNFFVDVNMLSKFTKNKQKCLK